MNLSLFSSQDLRRLADLVARKEEFLQAAAQIDSELAAITDPTGVPNLPALPAPSAPPVKERAFVDVFSPPAARQGSVGEQILGVLSSAGPEGAHFRDIANAVSRPVGSVNVWLAGETRRGRYPVRRVGAGRYALKGPNGSPAHSPAHPPNRKRKLAPHELSTRDAILEMFQSSPGVGFDYPLMSKLLGRTMRTLQCWLSVHRHEFPQIVRVRPGVFMWKP